MALRPKLIEVQSIGSSEIGYLSVLQGEYLPFKPLRIYWTYFTPNHVERGAHAHRQLEQLIVAVAGEIKIKIETRSGEKSEYIMDNPSKVLYIPRMCWRTLEFSHDAVLLCVASMEYNEEDYIRKYEDFNKQ